ncbi:hypothetical protein D3C87_1897890 [compost metagenome]
MNDKVEKELLELRAINEQLQKELKDCELLLMECLQVLYDINEGNVREGSLH